MTGSVKRVLLASLWHQTNTFSAGRTEVEDFLVEDSVDAVRGRIPGLTDIRRFGGEREWEILPAIFIAARSGATVADAVVEFFWNRFRAVVENESETGIDGVFLFMHGAMVSVSFSDVEGEILRRIRSLEGLSDVPICGVLDIHANFTEAMCREADGLIACRDGSGEDDWQAAYDASLLLDGLMDIERRPVTLREHPPILWPPAVAATTRETLVSLQNRARTLAHEIPDVSFINVFAGFPYSDVPEAGVSFTAIAHGDLELARSALRELNVLASSRRHFHVEDLTVGEIFARLRSQVSEQTLLLEPSDDVENGAPGNSRIVLEALVERDVQDALVVIHDPGAVERLKEYRPGDLIELAEEPLNMRGELVSKSKEHETNSYAMVKVRGVTVLLIGARTPVNSFDHLRIFGVEPENYSIIVLKLSKELRLLNDPQLFTIFVIDSPGPTPLRLERLPFRKMTRPVYPLDAL